MIERIFTADNLAARVSPLEIDSRAMLRARDRSLLHRSITLAIESAFRFGQDFPVGAVAAAGEYIVGRSFASDKRVGLTQAHAEFMAAKDAEISRMSIGTPGPDTIVVTLEPCNNCQDYLATLPTVKRVGFGLSRKQIADKGLVKPHTETIFQRALRVGLPYEIVQIEDAQLQVASETLLNHISRDPISELVIVDQVSLQAALIELNG